MRKQNYQLDIWQNNWDTLKYKIFRKIKIRKKMHTETFGEAEYMVHSILYSMTLLITPKNLNFS